MTDRRRRPYGVPWPMTKDPRDVARLTREPHGPGVGHHDAEGCRVVCRVRGRGLSLRADDVGRSAEGVHGHAQRSRQDTLRGFRLPEQRTGPLGPMEEHEAAFQAPDARIDRPVVTVGIALVAQLDRGDQLVKEGREIVGQVHRQTLHAGARRGGSVLLPFRSRTPAGP